MSHYFTSETKFTNQDYLVAALEQAGFAGQVEVHAEPQPMYMWNGALSDYKSRVIIRRNHVGRYANDMGFVENSDGTLSAIYDRDAAPFNQTARSMGGYEEWLGRLSAHYAIESAKAEFDKQGCDISVTEVDGKTTIVAKRRTVGGKLVKAVKRAAISIFA